MARCSTLCSPMRPRHSTTHPTRKQMQSVRKTVRCAASERYSSNRSRHVVCFISAHCDGHPANSSRPRRYIGGRVRHAIGPLRCETRCISSWTNFGLQNRLQDFAFRASSFSRFGERALISRRGLQAPRAAAPRRSSAWKPCCTEPPRRPLRPQRRQRPYSFASVVRF